MYIEIILQKILLFIKHLQASKKKDIITKT